MDKYKIRAKIRTNRTNATKTIPYITFIIPTIGRPTLTRTLESICSQTDPDWETIICFDEIKPTMPTTDKIKIINFHSDLKKPRSGPVRHHIMKFAKTKWIGLVDDDDTISPLYIEKLKQIEERDTDIIIFKQMYPNGSILTPPEKDKIGFCRIGISFAFRKDIYGTKAEFSQRSGTCVDFMFLSDAEKQGAKIKFTQDITYLVRHNIKGEGLKMPENSITKEELPYLHDWLLEIKPKRILELGQGLSTHSLKVFGEVHTIGETKYSDNKVIEKPEGSYDLAFIYLSDRPIIRESAIQEIIPHTNKIILCNTNSFRGEQIIKRNLNGWNQSKINNMTLFTR